MVASRIASVEQNEVHNSLRNALPTNWILNIDNLPSLIEKLSVKKIIYERLWYMSTKKL